MLIRNRRVRSFLAGSALFLAGASVASLATRRVSATNKFGQPKTVIHVVAYKFRPTTSLNDQQQIIAGIKEMAAAIPGIRNIWLKTERNQIRDFDGVYVIEFRARRRPPIMPRARFTRPGARDGSNCARTACPSRFRISRAGLRV